LHFLVFRPAHDQKSTDQTRHTPGTNDSTRRKSVESFLPASLSVGQHKPAAETETSSPIGMVRLSLERNGHKAGCAVTRLRPHFAIRSPPRLRPGASCVRRDGVRGSSYCGRRHPCREYHRPSAGDVAARVLDITDRVGVEHIVEVDFGGSPTAALRWVNGRIAVYAINGDRKPRVRCAS
jgi:hypothetical protein